MFDFEKEWVAFWPVFLWGSFGGTLIDFSGCAADSHLVGGSPAAVHAVVLVVPAQQERQRRHEEQHQGQPALPLFGRGGWGGGTLGEGWGMWNLGGWSWSVCVSAMAPPSAPPHATAGEARRHERAPPRVCVYVCA